MWGGYVAVVGGKITVFIVFPEVKFVTFGVYFIILAMFVNGIEPLIYSFSLDPLVA